MDIHCLLSPCPFAELKQLSTMQDVPVDLDPYVKKLANARRRVAMVISLMQTVQVCALVGQACLPFTGYTGHPLLLQVWLIHKHRWYIANSRVPHEMCTCPFSPDIWLENAHR